MLEWWNCTEKPEISDFIVFRVSTKSYENQRFSTFRELTRPYGWALRVRGDT